jgi:hypothetical protein
MKLVLYFVKSFCLGAVVMCLFWQCGSSNEPAKETDSTTSMPMESESSADSLDKIALDTLPFTIEFVEQSYTGSKPLPRLQSYTSAMSKEGEMLVLGGRRQGLHTFAEKPTNNFIPDSANNFIFVINPENGNYSSFDVNQLTSGDLSAFLQSTNQQAYYDFAKDQLYVIGGYGWKKDKSDMLTFPMIVRFTVADMVNAVKSNAPASKIEALFEVSKDERFAVTGGELYRMDNKFYLVFGQRFDGQYRAFGGSDFKQKYTEEVRTFTLKPNTLTILSYGAQTNSNADQPFHRRDGNIIDDINPANGQMRVTAFGGVFRPGIIGAYTNPIYINPTGLPVIDTTLSQKFSQYECPVISVYQEKSPNNTVYHTFFGGISHYYFFQTLAHKQAYDSVTAQGRNDGFPFIADVSTLQLSAKGTYKESFFPKSITKNRLLGASTDFMLYPDLIKNGMAFENGVIKLDKIPQDQKVLVGYIYGGIEAQNPLPLIPNTGTFVSNSLFKVFLTKKPYRVIPASKAKESQQNLYQRQ